MGRRNRSGDLSLKQPRLNRLMGERSPGGLVGMGMVVMCGNVLPARPGGAGGMSEESAFGRLGDGVLPPGHSELSIYGPQVPLGRVDGYLQPGGDVLSGQWQITENLPLPRAEYAGTPLLKALVYSAPSDDSRPPTTRPTALQR